MDIYHDQGHISKTSDSGNIGIGPWAIFPQYVDGALSPSRREYISYTQCILDYSFGASIHNYIEVAIEN